MSMSNSGLQSQGSTLPDSLRVHDYESALARLRSLSLQRTPLLTTPGSGPVSPVHPSVAAQSLSTHWRENDVCRSPFSNPVTPLLELIRRGPQRRCAISPPASPAPYDQVLPQSGSLHAVFPGPLAAAPLAQSADLMLEPLLQSMHDSFDYLYHICAMHQEHLN
jgi:hypothetical protein